LGEITMTRVLLASVFLSLGVAWVPGPQPGPTKTHQVKLNGQTFTLPVGFEIELVAGPPLVDRPISADFDEQGRLYVSDSSGSNEKVQEQLKKKPHRIVRLEDANGDGRFDKSVVFADRMMFPEGTMWRDGSLYVAAPPSIWKLTDTDGDGVADQRSEWFQGKTLTGCANDLHGPYLGPDGWIYWCKGAFAEQTYERPGKPPLITRAAHIFRARPDGSGVEPVMTGGMDNPVDVVFTPGGERIFTTTFLQHPAGGKRDGLIHAVYGGIYGKDHDPIYAHPWSGPSLMPVLVHLGAAAPCGLARYESRAFGLEYQDNVFACLFNMQKVTRHVLIPDGATFKTRDEDFLVSDSKDFHPTDVIEDADGSLLVIDTGGWYKLCCPTSQLVKPDVLGAIYRIRRTGAPRIDDPRGLKLAWETMSALDLFKVLADRRPAVQRRAIARLASLGKDALWGMPYGVAGGVVAEQRRNVVWAATRIDHPGARAVVRSGLADLDETVRQAALHSISLWRDRAAVPDLLKLLRGPSLHNRRAAAEALGRIGDKTAVPALLEALATPADRFLEHSLTFALIEIADAEATAAGLKSGNVHVRRAALTALDQIKSTKIDAAAVVAELASSDAQMRETAWWVASRHPEWGGSLAGFLRERLTAKTTVEEQTELAAHLGRLARAAAIQQLLAEQLRDPKASPQARQTVLRAMAQANLKTAPDPWVAALADMLGTNDTELLREAVATVRAVTLPGKGTQKLVAGLLGIGSDSQRPAALRLTALAAVPGSLPRVEPALFDFLHAHLGRDQPVATRSLAATVLARARLNADQLITLAGSLKGVGPMEVERVLEAFAQSSEDRVGQSLVAALKAAGTKSGVRVETLRPRLAKYGPAVQKQAEELYALLDVDAPKQKARLEELLASLKDGDVGRGHVVFNSPKAACVACHAIGYLGGKIGPDLTRIGGIRSERDLLEAIAFPSASFVQSYEPVLVTTREGKVFNGVVRRDAPDELVLALGADQEVRVARDDIENVQPSRVSVMPSGLDQQLTPRELADLVAFLRACK
jgi:putative membrane-bound dehydrogenase-like protein